MNERSACRRGRYLHNTQQTQQTNNYAHSGEVGPNNSDPFTKAKYTGLET